MATCLLDVQVAKATLEGLTDGHYYWLDVPLATPGQGTKTAATSDSTLADLGTTLTGTSVTPPTQGLLDLSPYDWFWLYVSHGALTGSVGGALYLAPLWPTGADRPASTPLVLGSPSSETALATTAESLQLGRVSVLSGKALHMTGVALFFTTHPSTASVLRVQVWGDRFRQHR